MTDRQGEWIEVDGVAMFIVGIQPADMEHPGWYDCAEPLDNPAPASCPTCRQILPHLPQFKYHLVPPEKATNKILRPKKWEL